MKVLLKVGYQDVLLPDDAGLTQVLKVLMRGISVHDRLYDGKKIELRESEMEVSVKLLGPDVNYVVEGKWRGADQAAEGGPEAGEAKAKGAIGRHGTQGTNGVRTIRGQQARLLLVEGGLHE